MLLADTLLCGLALLCAYLIRFDFVLSRAYLEQFGSLLPLILPSKILIFFVFGLYRGMWRYTSLKDAWYLAQACLASLLLVIALVTYLHRFEGFPRSVFLIDGLLSFLFCGGLRISIRSYYQKNSGFNIPFFSGKKFRIGPLDEQSTRVVLIGAGNAGEKILREILENKDLSYRAIGFLDDDRNKHGRKLHGIPILGNIEYLPQLITHTQVDEAFITLPSASGQIVRRIMEICEQSGLKYKTLPGLGQLMEGSVFISELREIHIEDLLGRESVRLELRAIQDWFAGQTVLITGCGGSIGSELCHQMVRFQPRRMILLDNHEASLYKIENELEHEYGYDASFPILGDICDSRHMEQIFAAYRPSSVFHAAAFKHVPMLEHNPWRAVNNNILGGKVLMKTALAYGTGHFVLVSTDKAVRPINVMGATKRVNELLAQSLQGQGTRFFSVRFGNVIGSSGSVIPLFQRQIRLGGPVTVTHPEVTRYFMTIPEAAQLILQAALLGRGGEIFVLEMGSPVKIMDMAKDLIRLSGKKPDTDIQIVTTGLRKGEKLYEELFTQGEGIVSTRHDKIMVLKDNGQSHAGSRNSSHLRLEQKINELGEAAQHFDGWRIRQLLQEIVPEYSPQDHEAIIPGQTQPINQPESVPSL